MATDDEVQAKKASVQALRERLADAKQNQLDQVRQAQNDTIMASLNEEEARLNAELAEVEATVAVDVAPPPDPAPVTVTPQVTPAVTPPKVVTPSPVDAADDTEGK